MNRRQAIAFLATSGAGASFASTAPLAAPDADAGTAVRSLPASHIATRDGTLLYYQDLGSGKPIVFLHSLGTCNRQWQYNTVPLVNRGFRCIAYDRRSHGRSSDPGRGYDYDTLASDLAAVLDQLELREATLVGHSMSGGELVRYVTRYGTGRVGRLVLVAPTLPFILRTADNPDGVDRQSLDALRASWLVDYSKWAADNARPFFAPDTSDAMVQWGIGLLTETSLKAILDCHRSLAETDFRKELTQITVPTLIVHGDKDASAQIDFTGRRTARLIPGCEFKVYEGAAHGLFITHAKRFNEDVAAFAGG
jgi:non-heme chloroperoxidase